MKITAARFPWQRKTPNSPFIKEPNGKWGWGIVNMGRFGGGWNYKLGIDVGGKSVIINLIIGAIRITWSK